MKPATCTPFQLVPWCRDLLPQLVELVQEFTDGHPGKALVVFPHDRPKRYLAEAFQVAMQEQGGKACLLPAMYSVRELFTQLRAKAVPGGETPARISRLEQVSLLYRLCQEIAERDHTSPLYSKLTEQGAAGFFPWGEQLADLLEECLVQGIEAQDLAHAEQDVSPFAAALLASLGQIFTAYVEAMHSQKLSSPGLDAFWLAAHPEVLRVSPLLNGRCVILVGFNALSGAEEKVFRELWQLGAHIVLHSDPALATEGSRGGSHWSCGAHKTWMHKWGASVLCRVPPAGTSPQLHFFSGYDLHSQLQALAHDLTATPTSGINAKAVALTHPELLLPVLHHLPDKQCNISIGYPLSRTLLHKLLETSMHAAEAMDSQERIPWRLLAEISRHPWLCQLQTGQDSLHEVLWHMERHICRGAPWQDPKKLVEAVLEEIQAPPDIASLLHSLMDVLLYGWKRAKTLEDMASCLEKLCELFVLYGDTVWQRFLLDAECLYRLGAHTIPELRENSLANEPLPMPLRHTMLRSVLRAERVPFEADPITGLQVLGMLETRLLHFEHVFVLDATDDHLPGAPKSEGLLPDSLRALLGLPDNQYREELAAHTFFRLLAGARHVHLYWQEGVEAKGLLDAKKERSRFIEALIWALEQKEGRVFTAGSAPLHSASLKLVPPERTKRSIEKGEAQHKALQAFLEKPLSASSLDAYIRCPLAFYYTYLAKLREPDAVNEGDDPPAVGELLHKVLYEAYVPLVGKELEAGHMDITRLHSLFLQQLETSPLLESLPPESVVMLKVAGLERLRRYLAAQGPLRVQALEQSMQAPLWDGSPYRIQGRLDRVDIRDQGPYIVDYKSGRIPKLSSHLLDEELWHNCANSLVLPEAQPEFLERVQGAISSIQLLVYTHLYSKNLKTVPYNAVWADLGGSGTEQGLFGEKVSEQDRDRAITQDFPLLFEAIVHHMCYRPHFEAHEGSLCRFCVHKSLCTI